MAAKKTHPKTTQQEDPKPLKVGSRVRCTDDGILGRITWANAASVKNRWDDGEAVTWRRDSLAARPVQIIDDEPEAAPVQASAPEQLTEAAPAQPAEAIPVEPVQASAPADPPPTEPAAAGTPEATAVPAKKKPGRKAAKAKDNGDAKREQKKLSALDAAAKVLAQAGTPMNCQELIAAMAAKGYWSSPAGKTPHATLYAAILRETQTKGDQSHFQKADRGTFTLRTTATQE